MASPTSDDRPWQLVETEDWHGSRRRLVYLLSSGRRRAVIIGQAEDSNETRIKIGDALESENRRLIRGGQTVEG